MVRVPQVVGYARVSTGEQLDALAAQRARLEQAGVTRIIEDVQSGLEADRSGYQELLSAIQAGSLSSIIVTRLDRLGRDAAEVDGLLAFAARHKITIRAIDGGELENQSPGGFALTRVMTTMAELESRMLSLRVRSSLKARRLTGAPLRGRAPWGYRVSEDRQRFELCPIEGPRAKEFLRLLEANNWRSQTTLNEWRQKNGALPLNTVSSVNTWLTNPVLRGGIGYHKAAGRTYQEIIWLQHEPLISDEQFRHVSITKEMNRRFWGKNVSYKHRLLTGLVRCGHCGQRMSYIPHRKIPSLLCHNAACPRRYKTVYEAGIVQDIHKALCAKAQNLATAVVNDNPEAEKLLEQIKRLEAEADKDLAPVIEAKKNKLQALQRLPSIDPQLVKDLARPEFWELATEEERRDLFQELVVEVVVENLMDVTEVRLRF